MEATVAERRRALDLDSLVFAPTSPPLESVTDLRVNERIAVRIYRPRGLSARAPGVVYIHGGGFSGHRNVTRESSSRIVG